MSQPNHTDSLRERVSREVYDAIFRECPNDTARAGLAEHITNRILALLADSPPVVLCGDHCGTPVTQCAGCAVADWQGAHPECPDCCTQDSPPIAGERERALEEAARLCESEALPVENYPDYPQDAYLRGFAFASRECASMIRSLRAAPTSGPVTSRPNQGDTPALAERGEDMDSTTTPAPVAGDTDIQNPTVRPETLADRLDSLAALDEATASTECIPLGRRFYEGRAKTLREAARRVTVLESAVALDSVTLQEIAALIGYDNWQDVELSRHVATALRTSGRREPDARADDMLIRLGMSRAHHIADQVEEDLREAGEESMANAAAGVATAIATYRDLHYPRRRRPKRRSTAPESEDADG